MKLNTSYGNMYDFVTHTFNTVKGTCEHDCSYCYMKNWHERGAIKLDNEEFKTDLGTGNFIFVGSGTDLFAQNVPKEWIIKTLDYCQYFNNGLFDCFGNRYLFQSKNPKRILEFITHPVFEKSVVCTTIETNRNYPEIMNNSPKIIERVLSMEKIAEKGIKTFVTIEPIMYFDLPELLAFVKRCKPDQVNIGANSKERIITLQIGRAHV